MNRWGNGGERRARASPLHKPPPGQAAPGLDGTYMGHFEVKWNNEMVCIKKPDFWPKVLCPPLVKKKWRVLKFLLRSWNGQWKTALAIAGLLLHPLWKENTERTTPTCCISALISKENKISWGKWSLNNPVSSAQRGHGAAKPPPQFKPPESAT